MQLCACSNVLRGFSLRHITSRVVSRSLNMPKMAKVVPPLPEMSSLEPSQSKQYRFEDTGFPSESAEDYRPGGLHPIDIGDKFRAGRYHIIRKLGYGSYATVWLASDCQTARLVAIKIMQAKASIRSSVELSISSSLAQKAKDDPLAKHVVMLLDTFEHTGPNGVHRCLVFEPMGPSTASMVEELPCNQPRMRDKQPRYPKNMAKSILKHALSGLVFLHKNGIVHGDVQPGNILFSLSDMSSVDEGQLLQDRETISAPLRRLDGKTDSWAPKSLALNQTLHQFVDLGPGLTIKLSDFGSAFWVNHPPRSTVTPVALRAPESLFSETFGFGIDIWAFGCLTYEFLTGTQLFSVFMMGYDEQDDVDDDHILELTDVLGPLPERLMSKWARKEKWIGPEGQRLMPPERYDIGRESEDGDSTMLESMSETDDHEAHASDDESQTRHDQLHANGIETNQSTSQSKIIGYQSGSPREDVESSSETDAMDIVGNQGNESHSPHASEGDDNPHQNPYIADSLELQFDRNKPDDIDEVEAKKITSLIRDILRYEPSERPSAEQLLRHPWFQS